MKGRKMKKKHALLERNGDVSVEPLLVDVKTVEKMLGICERTVRTLTKNGELPVVKLTSRVLYSVEDLIEFVRQRSTREAGDKSEPLDFTQGAALPTVYNPVEWVIPYRAALAVGHG